MGETSGPEGPVQTVVRTSEMGIPGERDLPLRDARKRLTPKRPPHPKRALSAEDRGVAIGLAAAGVPSTKIASALEVKKTTIDNIRRPGWSNDKVQAIREKLKMRKMRNAYRIEDKLWNLVEKKIDEGDAKAVDGAMRAVHASEKIQQAVAGEAMKVEHTGQVTPQDLEGMIQILIQGKS